MESFEVFKFIFSWAGRATAGSSYWLVEKKISRRELAMNSWKRHITIFIIEKRVEQMKHLLNLFD